MIDVNSLIIAAAIIVSSAILLYTISIFAMKQKTFEEVMAEQKRQEEAELMKLKMAKKAEREHTQRKKIKKKQSDKSKEKQKPSLEAHSHDENEQSKVSDEEIGPEIIKPLMEPGIVITSSPQKSKSISSDVAKPAKTQEVKGGLSAQKGKRVGQMEFEAEIVKPVLKEQDGKVIVNPQKVKKVTKLSPSSSPELKATAMKATAKDREGDAVTSKTSMLGVDVSREQDNKKVKVEDHATEKKRSVPDAQEKIKPKASGGEKRENEPVIEEMVVSAKAKNTQHAAPQKPVVATVSPSRTAGASSKLADVTIDQPESDMKVLMKCVEKCNLTDNEVHDIIEALNAKYEDASTFTSIKKKGDPLTMLRNQLEEKEKALQEEQQLAMSAHSRLKDMKAELVQEKSQFSELQKSSMDKLTAQSQEIQALQSRMQQTHDNHMVEMASLKQQHEAAVLKISEETKQQRETLTKTHVVSQSNEVTNLKNKVQILQNEMNNNAIKLNASERKKKKVPTATLR